MIFYLVIILSLTILAILFLYAREILYSIDYVSSHLRWFVHRNSGIFSLSFILIFFAEQILLIILVFYVYDVSSEAEFLISIFALIVITTASLEKFILEKKYQYLMRETSRVSSQNELTLTEMKDLLDKYRHIKEENRNLKRKSKQ